MCEKLRPPRAGCANLHTFPYYNKKKHKFNQPLGQDAQKKANSAPPPMPDAGTLKGNMIMEIRMILNDDQKKTFQEIVDDMGKKKKKANN